MTDVALIGVGITKFGRYEKLTLKALAAPTVTDALVDANVDVADIDMAFVANTMAAPITGQTSVVGQSILREFGFSGLPVFNIDNACAGSSSALSLAVHAIRAGAARTALVVGVEKLYSSDRAKTFRALNGAADLEALDLEGLDLGRESIFIKLAYPPRVQEYRAKHPLDSRTLAAITVKNRGHAGLNPVAQYTKPLTIDNVLESRIVVEPITALMCAPIGDGAAAVVVAGADVARSHGRRAVWIRASEVGMASKPGESTLHRVARQAYARAGVEPGHVDVAEVHDSISFNELVAYEELGLCEPGDGARLVDEGETSLGGSIPVNTSGGLESRGHPIAATGLAQIVELATQVRGEAGERQVPDARVALAENAGGYVAGDTAALAITILADHAA